MGAVVFALVACAPVVQLTSTAHADDAEITCPESVGSYLLSEGYDVPQSVIGQYSYSCYYRDPARLSTEVLTLHSKWNDWEDVGYCDQPADPHVLYSGTHAAFVSWGVSSYDVIEPPGESEVAAGELLNQFEFAAGMCSGASSDAGSDAGSDVGSDSGSSDVPAVGDASDSSTTPSLDGGGDTTTRNVLAVIAALIGVITIVKLHGRRSKRPALPMEPVGPKAPPATLPLVDDLTPVLIGASATGTTGAPTAGPTVTPTPPTRSVAPSDTEEMLHELEHVWHDIQHPIDTLLRTDPRHRPCVRCGAPAAGLDAYCGNCGAHRPPESFDPPEPPAPAPETPARVDPSAPSPPGVLDEVKHELEHTAHSLRHPLEVFDDPQPLRPCPCCGSPAPCLTAFCIHCGTRLPDEAL
jgi:hypothetical protein